MHADRIVDVTNTTMNFLPNTNQNHMLTIATNFSPKDVNERHNMQNKNLKVHVDIFLTQVWSKQLISMYKLFCIDVGILMNFEVNLLIILVTC